MIDEAGMTRRQLVRAGLGAAGALSVGSLLAACGGAATQQVRGEQSTLTIAHADTPPGLDSDQVFSTFAEEIGLNCYGGDVVRYKTTTDEGVKIADVRRLDTGGIANGLAESITASDDLRSFEFKLNPKAKSFYGNPITAEAVKWSFDRRRALGGIGDFFVNVMFLTDPKSVEVVDEGTIRFNLPKPNPIFLQVDALCFYGGVFDLAEVRKHITEEDEWAKTWLNSHTAGFGPYHVETYRKGQQVTLIANPNYVGGRRPIETVIWRAVSEGSERLALITRGDVDLVDALTPRQLDQLKGSDDVTTVNYVGNVVKAIKLNNAEKPFDDVRVRQAIAYATPYEQILDEVFYGTASQMKSPLVEIDPTYTDRYWTYGTDEAKAKALLAEAGLSGGFSTELLYDLSLPEDGLIAPILRTALGKVGIQLELRGVPAAVYAESVSTRNFQATLGVHFPFVIDPGFWFFLHWTSDSFLNTVNYKNPEFDALVDELLTEVDAEKRRALSEQGQEILMRDLPWVGLVYPGFHVPHRAELKGLTWYPTNNISYEFLTKS
ncbi:MAG: ABC transporter substrate-binding protein [Vicinamibacterales bacterium]